MDQPPRGRNGKVSAQFEGCILATRVCLPQWAGNENSWMESWLGCWKTHGREGEVLRTPISPDLTLLTLQTLWRTRWLHSFYVLPQAVNILKRCLQSGLDLAHSHVVCIRGIGLCHWMTHGEKLSFFCSVDLSQNDSFLILSLPNTCFCNQRKDASIYCIFPTDFYSWRVFLSSSKSLVLAPGKW